MPNCDGNGNDNDNDKVSFAFATAQCERAFNTQQYSCTVKEKFEKE